MLTGLRDTDLIIMNELNDKDLLAYCQTDKIGVCRNEDFWRNRFIKVHDEAASKFKNKDRSWKDYYLAVIYYTEKYSNERAAKETAKKDYMDLFLFFSRFIAEYDKIAAIVETGNKKYINMIKDTDIPAILANIGLVIASKNENRELMDFFISKAANPVYIDLGILEGENADLIYNTITNSTIDPNMGLFSSIKGDNMELIRYFISKGAKNWEEALRQATLVGNKNLVDFFVTKARRNPTVGLIAAVQGGHKNLIDFFLSRGALFYPDILLLNARISGDKEIISYVEKLRKQHGYVL